MPLESSNPLMLILVLLVFIEVCLPVKVWVACFAQTNGSLGQFELLDNFVLARGRHERDCAAKGSLRAQNWHIGCH